MLCRNGIRPSGEVDGRLDVIFSLFLNEKRKSRDREYGNKREWEEEASRRLLGKGLYSDVLYMTSVLIHRPLV